MARLALLMRAWRETLVTALLIVYAMVAWYVLFVFVLPWLVPNGEPWNFWPVSV